MTTCTILLAPSHRMIDFVFNKDAAKIAREMYKNREYETVCKVETVFDDDDAAEEMFDLTNNPNRQDERVRLYGRGRSLSTGDIVLVSGVPFLCCSSGWEVL